MTHSRRSMLTGLGLTVVGALLPGAAACGGAEANQDAGDVKGIAAVVSGRVVTPPPARVDVAKGQTVRVTVTSDVTDVLHVHGYDRSTSLQPGIPGTIEFVADQAGLFEVETHGAHLQICQLAVR